MKVIVTWGQDTPAYAESTIEIEVQGDATDANIIAAVKAKADTVGDLVFRPSWDWSGLRIVDITKADGTCVANDIPIEPCGEDLGIVAHEVMTGKAGPMALVHEAERQGISIHPDVARAIESAQTTVSAMQAMQDFQIPTFTPFTLVIDAFTCDEFGDGPSHAKIAVTPEFLLRIARLVASTKPLGIRSAHVADDDAIWRDPAMVPSLHGTELVVMPLRGAFGKASFFFQGHPKNTNYNCKTRAVDLKDLIACIGKAGELPIGFKREYGVLFYDGGSGSINALVRMYMEKDDATDRVANPWVIYHYGQPNGERFWSEDDGWTELASATRYDEMPTGLYPMGGPENTQAGALCIGTMLPFTVTLRGTEDPGSDGIAFECFAESDAHAIEQAENAYPNIFVDSVQLTEAIED